MYMTCALAIYTGRHAHSLIITKASIDLQESDPSIAIYKHTPMARAARARARSHAQALVATHTYCMSHPVIRTKTTI